MYVGFKDFLELNTDDSMDISKQNTEKYSIEARTNWQRKSFLGMKNSFCHQTMQRLYAWKLRQVTNI